MGTQWNTTVSANWIRAASTLLVGHHSGHFRKWSDIIDWMPMVYASHCVNHVWRYYCFLISYRKWEGDVGRCLKYRKVFKTVPQMSAIAERKWAKRLSAALLRCGYLSLLSLIHPISICALFYCLPRSGQQSCLPGGSSVDAYVYIRWPIRDWPSGVEEMPSDRFGSVRWGLGGPLEWDHAGRHKTGSLLL